MTTYCVIIDGHQKTTTDNIEEAERLVLGGMTGYGSCIVVIKDGVCTDEIEPKEFEVLKRSYPKIDGRLLAKLMEVFPASFNLVRLCETHDYIPGPWGMEKTFVDYEIVCLADCILNTAEAFRKKYGIEDALDYIQQFANKGVQKSESRGYNFRSEL